METINNIAAAASKAVWGTDDTKKDQPTQEPLSGVVGNTKQGEPYDAGNMDPPPPASIPLPATEVPTPAADLDQDFKKLSHNPVSSSSLDPSSHNHTNSTTTTTTTSTNPDHLGSHADKAPTSLSTSDSHKPITTTTNDYDTRDPKHDQESTKKPEIPAPRTLEELAREHGGDAGAVTPPNGTTTGHHRESSSGLPTAAHPDDKGGNQAFPATAHKGSGEQYVKSSGLSADGGNFDATKPGAGKEADRLLHEKGIETSTKPTDHSTAHDSKDTSEPSSPKPSLGQRIKDKLHIHK